MIKFISVVKPSRRVFWALFNEQIPFLSDGMCTNVTFPLSSRKKKKKDKTCSGLQYPSDDIVFQSHLKKDTVSRSVFTLPEMHAWPERKPVMLRHLDTGFPVSFPNIYLLL